MRCVGGTWSVVTKQGQVKPDHARPPAPHPIRQPCAAATAVARSAVAPLPSLVCITCHRCEHCATDQPTSCHRARRRHCCWSKCMRKPRAGFVRHCTPCDGSGWRSARARVPNGSTSEYCWGVKVATCPPDGSRGILCGAGDVHPRHPVRAEHDVQPTEVITGR